MHSPEEKVGPREAACFETTQWSVVLAAGASDSAQRAAALERLCRTYWPPVFAFVRRNGKDLESAKDVTQEFFARLLQRQDLASVRREKGRFRSYLLVALKHFLTNEWLRTQTQKRGGGHFVLPLEEVLAEGRFEFALMDTMSADKIYDRRWAQALLDYVFGQLRAECRAAGKARQFDWLQGFITEEPDTPSQAEAARALGLSVGAVKQAVLRLRNRYRRLLREEVARTLADPADLEDELHRLVSALRS